MPFARNDTVMTEDSAVRPELPRVAGRKHPGWWVVTALVLAIGVAVGRIFVTSPAMQWDVVARYLTAEQILAGVARTMQLTVIAMLAGVTLGAVLAMMRLSPIKILSSISWAYIWFFRGTPLIVQIIFWYNLGALAPEISLGIPFGPTFYSVDANEAVTPFVAAILALSLNEAAYMAEIVRAGILSVDSGQKEASAALGMRHGVTMRRIILPQAMRVVIPPTGNQTIGMLKSTALVSVTSLPELLYSAQLIYSKTFETIPLLVVVSLWYLAITTVLTCGQFYIERHYARGSNRELPPTPLQTLRRRLRPVGRAPRRA